MCKVYSLSLFSRRVNRRWKLRQVKLLLNRLLQKWKLRKWKLQRWKFRKLRLRKRPFLLSLSRVRASCEAFGMMYTFSCRTKIAEAGGFDKPLAKRMLIYSYPILILGCGDCVEACQFDAIHMNPETGLPVKFA